MTEEKKQQAEGTQQQAPQQQPAPRPCPQDCRRCSMDQRLFCSTKMLFDLSRSQQQMAGQVAWLMQAVAALQEQARKKDDGVQLSLPFAFQDNEEEEAQEEDGAENRSS